MINESLPEQTIIFGGSFNPPTLAHEAIIAACLELPQFKHDEIWVMPSGDRFDKSIAISDENRLDMLELIKHEKFNDNPRLQISDFELHLTRPTQTYQTVKELTENYKNRNFWFVLGADAYLSMPAWDHGDELMKSLHMILFARGENPNMHGDNIINLEIADLAIISSTLAREAIQNSRSTVDLISRPIDDYIKEHELYI